MTAKPDLVYPYKHSSGGEELRYSLRSLATNAAGLFGKVWVVGDRPDWLTGVEHVEVEPGSSRLADMRAKWLAAANHPEISERFLLMTDDLWLVRRIYRLEAYHMGPVSQFLAAQGHSHRQWRTTIATTAEWVAEQGHPDTLVRQGHHPAMFDKARLAQALAAYPAERQLDVLGLYDLAGAGGEGTRVGNAKITSSAQFHTKTAPAVLDACPWLSASDEAFADGLIGGYVRALFPTPCPFEEAA